MHQVLLVLTNLADAEQAQAIAAHLVEQRLAACVNILPAVQSIYHWQGVITHTSEITLLIKTTQTRYSEVEAAITKLHPYDLPEIIAIPISDGLPSYLQWIAAETSREMNA